jgi:hypothetical protein
MSDKQHFETGSQRDTNNGKPRFDLMTPFIKKRLGELLRKGAEHYGSNNWLLGQPSSRYWESFTRHSQKYEMGETDEDHLSAMIWNLCGIMHNEEVAGTDTEINVNGEWHKLPKELLDFPIFRQVIFVGIDTENAEYETAIKYIDMGGHYQDVIQRIKQRLDTIPVDKVIEYQRLKEKLENVEAQYKKFKEGVR